MKTLMLLAIAVLCSKLYSPVAARRRFSRNSGEGV